MTAPTNPASAPAGAFVFVGGTSEPGGLHVHTADVALAVAAAGHPVAIVCPSVDHFSAMLGGTPVRVEVVPARGPREDASTYWSKHLAHHRGATAVLCEGKLGETPAADLLALRGATGRLLTIAHRDWDPPWPHPLPRWLYSLVCRRAVTRLLAVSAQIADSARKSLCFPAGRVSTCLNWVDPRFTPAAPEERARAKTRLGLPADALVVGYHGRLAPEKRVDALIRAAHGLGGKEKPGIVFAIIGDGWKRLELEALSDALHVPFRFLGWHPDAAAAVAAFDIAVLPSLAEGFPLGLMEAMACGAACLAHPMSSTVELLRPGENGVLADLADEAAFAGALAALVRASSSERARLGAAAAETIRRGHSRARRLPDVLRALGVDCSDGAPPPPHPRRLVFARTSS